MTSAAEWLSDPEKGIAKKVRPAQVRMAGIVEDALRDGGRVLVEAGTGTGKSFSYLVPALLSGKRVVVSTAKKTLQSQIRDADLPFLLERLGLKVTTASLKGKSNYACHLRMAEFLRSPDVARYSAREVNAFAAWQATNVHGEMDDYAQNPEFAHHVRVNECVAKTCPHAESCGYRLARAQAVEAKIVVINHALLAFDLMMGGGKIVGAYDALIIDEAHQAPKFFREARTCRIQGKQPEALRKLLEHSEIHVPETLELRVGSFLRLLPDKGIVPKRDAIVSAAMAVARDLEQMKAQFMIEGVWSEPGVIEPDDNGMKDAAYVSKLRAAATVTQRMLQACEVCADKLDTKFNADGAEVVTAEDFVSYAETRVTRGEVHREFVVSPIEIGPFVGPVLRKVKTVVCTSATLATAGGNFDYVRKDFGFKEADVTFQEVLVQTFNYAKQSCLFASTKTTEYRYDKRHEYWGSCVQVMHELFNASKGGALVLCASYEDMNAFHERLQAIPGKAYDMRTQSGNVDALIDWFKQTGNGVALGVKSIWEGVDIPGLGLRLVVIPRLPFPNPDDPVLTARKAKYVAGRVRQGQDERMADIQAWQHYDLQEAVMDFKQGVGRLIRRETDMGVVAVLDSRVVGTAKRYSGSVRSSVPHPTTYDIEAVKAVLKGLSTRV